MRAIVFDGPNRPLRAETRALPEPGSGQLLLRVNACGVCRTDLHLLDGEVVVREPASHPRPSDRRNGPGRRPERGRRRRRSRPAGRGPWLGWTCGECEWCRSGRENLCPQARFTGRDIDGGMAEYTVADARYCFPIPEDYPDDQAAPLLCAGLIGWRSLRMCGEARRIGLYGFGAAAHIIAQVAAWQGRSVFALTRPGDSAAGEFARELGAVWAGGSDEHPPEELEAAIVFAPEGALVPLALRALRPGGTVVCGGIHMSDIPSFPYEILWGERTIRSVANLIWRGVCQGLSSFDRVRVGVAGALSGRHGRKVQSHRLRGQTDMRGLDLKTLCSSRLAV